jgi:hypothetical protein
MRKLMIATTAIAALLLGSLGPTLAAHKSVTSPPTQGNSGKTNDNANEDNNGQVTTTTTGPKGQVDKGKTEDNCNNCTTTTSGPGNK